MGNSIIINEIQRLIFLEHLRVKKKLPQYTNITCVKNEILVSIN